MDIFEIFKQARDRSASDIHLIAGSLPMLRVNGSLEPIGDKALAPEDVSHCFSQITTPEEKEVFERTKELDFAYSLPDTGRVRCNVARQRGAMSLAIRMLPSKIPSLQDLGVPEVCKDLIMRPRGLVIISGPTGSGKSTTLAAMINYLNASKSRHIVTIEDPIEYIYSSIKSVVTQRELGSDTLSFFEALRHVLRQTQYVILVGEMRDTETAAAVLTIAETGHLILTTGHAPSATQAIERVIDMFPVHERNLVQTRLASLLIGVLCQALVPRADGHGRVAAVEVMLANPAVRNLIREGKIFQLPNVIRTQTSVGMQLLDQALVNLYNSRKINHDHLLAFCNERDEVERLITEIRA